MVPSAKKLEVALLKGTEEIFKADPDATTVNKVRRHVEEQLNLKEGFFADSDWKQRSKDIIKNHVEKLLEGGVLKGGIGANEETRQGSDEVEVAPRIKKNQSRKTSTNKAQTVSDGQDEDSQIQPRRKSKALIPSEDEADPDRDSGGSHSRKRKRSVDKGPSDDTKSATDEQAPDKNIVTDDSDDKGELDDESDQYSDVIDVASIPKRTKKKKKEQTPNLPKPTKSTSQKAASTEDPQEVEIKKLQSQLTKCGVRKLWHNELKHCGDDSKAKIRHLRKMLTDVGMDGRFSEAKAREIKETRELLAEAEAAQEMNRLWGMESGGRKSRNKSKNAKVVESDASDDEQGSDGSDVADEEEEEEEVSFAARRRRAHADLAFLGDDSDSD